MDVNNTPYILIKDRSEFEHDSTRYLWDARRPALTLAQDQELRIPHTDPEEALTRWRASGPLVLDPFGQIGRIAPSGEVVEYNSGRNYHTLQDGELNDIRAPEGHFTDLALGGDGRLVACYTDEADQHGVLVFHLARRWQTRVALPEAPVCAGMDQDNRVWCATETHLVLCEGEPLPLPYLTLASRFEPVDVNPHPLRTIWRQPQPLPAGLSPLAMCVGEDQLYLLTYNDARQQQILERALSVVPDRPWRVHALSAEVPFVTDLDQIAAGRFGAISPQESDDTSFRQRDCPVLELVWDSETETGEARLIRERYPMLSQAAPRFVSSLDEKTRYQAEPDPEHTHFTPRPRELHPLPRSRYFIPDDSDPDENGATLLKVLDSGSPDSVWHRVYIEGCIPAGTSLTLFARSGNDPDGLETLPWIEQRQPLWSPLSSELPFHEGLVKSKPRESGLFEILLQRPNGNVRRVTGRYLQLRIRMYSDGLHTPAIHALRVYYPRFSYQEKYLPEHFRQEQTYREPAPGTGEPANGADVRERFFAAFEGVLTPIEGKVAATEALLDPDATPAFHLPWVAETLGLKLPDYWPEARRRRFLKHGTLLQKWRGTYRGVRLALDMATDWAVRRGEIVVIENFRLRRTMATLLGIDMDDRDHPLTLGTGMSGNSIVGESLILSEEDARTFLALFAPELATEDEKAAVKAFFDRYSHQVTILLHGRARQERQLVEALLADQMPAHVRWHIFETDHPFVLGLAPLLSVDTYLEVKPPPRRVTLDDTYLGKEGVLRNPLALSPRDVNARPASP